MLLKWSSHISSLSFKFLSTCQSLRWNHYKSLGLTPSASLADVKAAYYKLSKIHHPDLNNGSEASAKKFRDIVAAYEVLSKADLRRKYDREIVKKYESRNVDFAQRKRGSKRVKKNQNTSKVKSPRYKSGNLGKSKYKKSGGPAKGTRKNTHQDLDSLIVRVLPLVIPCLLYYKKCSS